MLTRRILSHTHATISGWVRPGFARPEARSGESQEHGGDPRMQSPFSPAEAETSTGPLTPSSPALVFFLRQATLSGVINHMTMSNSLLCRTLLQTLPILFWTSLAMSADPTPNPPLAWPEITRQSRPSAYWWWMGSAVDAKNLTHELQRYSDAGLGGVHIIPIYGAKGWENKYIDYLSPPWMDMLRHTIVEAQRLDLNVDMTMGSGWCFGGPNVTESEANAVPVVKVTDVTPGGRFSEKMDRTIQSLMAFSEKGECIDLLDKAGMDGSLNWTAEGGKWRVYKVSQKPSGQKVKRPAPGGAGHMINLFYPKAMQHYLEWFEQAFANYSGPKPRSMYHDSYEYRSEWAPDFFAQFEKRRGYRLQTELPYLFGAIDNDRAARVKCDYRETISDVMAGESLPAWTKWCHDHGIITRNQAHGSPGNLLDLYAVADIPETEMFHTDRNRLVSKFASSAAHVTGRQLTAAETGTWLQEHFTETLADMKYLLDDLFLSGVNHVFYHGTCYSPDEAAWPGWLFYASFEMNPRNSIWRDVPALNAYAARCQSILQHGHPDAEVLLYWPIHDRWHNAKGLVQNFSVHARDWLEGQPIGKTAEQLWNKGFAFDYASDRQLETAKASGGSVELPGGRYQVIVVPSCEHIRLPVFQKLVTLAEHGAAVLFENQLPADVPGWGDLEHRRSDLKKLLARIKSIDVPGGQLKAAKLGQGLILTGNLLPTLAHLAIPFEPMVEQDGLFYIRRSFDGGKHYFIANRTTNSFSGWVTLSTHPKSVVIMDPMTGRTGVAASRKRDLGHNEFKVVLQPGESLILRAFASHEVTGVPWSYRQMGGKPLDLPGPWRVSFVQGGPDLPPEYSTTNLSSWAETGGEVAQRFAGTARYSTSFDAPAQGNASGWVLDLGRVCQSARVRLNGHDLGTVFVPPFRVWVPELQPKGNALEVEVTNVAANRIRDLDRRNAPWKNFHDINFVNINYKPFDASNWPLTDSGLLGPVRLVMSN